MQHFFGFRPVDDVLLPRAAAHYSAARPAHFNEVSRHFCCAWFHLRVAHGMCYSRRRAVTILVSVVSAALSATAAEPVAVT